ncbi:uncharacterized protein [Dermacentor andersoni]|uniref:uncharacterized protein n=1 Tax=Dermacentor andersoni TaxID=34620 RepID=UPI0024166AEC|nr:uncharacterized protein LOC126534772 [Dermacentor andersoni]
MASKDKPTAGRDAEGKAGGAGGLGAKATTTPGRKALGVGPNSPRARNTPGQKRNGAEDRTQQDSATKSSDHRVEAPRSAAGHSVPKATASSKFPNRPKAGSSSASKTAAGSPRTAVATPKDGGAKLKPKSSVTNPKHYAAGARAVGGKPKATKVGGADSEHEEPGTRTASLKRTLTKSGNSGPKAESGRTSPGSLKMKSGAASLKGSVQSPKRGAATARGRGAVGLRNIIKSTLKAESSRKSPGTANLRSSAASPKSGVATAGGRSVGSANKGATSPKTKGKSAAVSRVGSAHKAGSLPTSGKSVKGKTGVKLAITATDDEGGKDDEEKAARKRHYGRRKSIVAAAMARFRKSMKPDQEGGSKSSTETLSSKDQMSLFLVVTVAGFLVVFMAILIFFFFLGGTNIPEGVACITDECLEAKQYLDSLLNDTRNPCTDFYGYVCGSWKGKGGSFYDGAAMSALFRLNATLRGMREIKRKEEIRQGMHILKPIYSGCYTYMSKPVKLTEALHDAQLYLEIEKLMNSRTFFDVVRYLVQQSLQVGVYTLFHLRFIYEAGRPMLFISEGYSLSGKLGQPFGNVHDIFVRILQVLFNRTDVDDQLDLLTTMDAEVEKIFSTGERKMAQVMLRDALHGMVTGVSAEDWVAAVRASHREEIALVVTDDILTNNSGVYKPAMQAVTKHGVTNATFYLATNLEADMLYVLSQHSIISKHDVSKGFYCLYFTHKCLALTWAYLAARLLAPVGSTGVIYNMLKFMKEIVSETQEAFSWMKNATAVKAMDEVSKTSLQVVAGEGFNISRVDYAGPTPALDEEDSFLKNLLIALRHHHTVMAANPPTLLELRLSDYEFSSSLTYVREKKAILVPTLYQNNPYVYLFRVPDFFNYGTLAALLARELVTGAVGSLQNDWNDETRAQHAQVLRCLAERRKSLGFGGLSPDGGERKEELVLTLTISVRIAYYALMKSFRIQAGTGKMFNEYWPAAEQVFFARYCLLWCSASEVANPLTPREKCMLPLYNMEEFVDHYGCKDRANFTTAPFCKV